MSAAGERRGSRRASHRPPTVAALLGYAGLIPAWAAVAAALTGAGDLPGWAAVAAGFVYGAVILSFLGGLWWGGAAARLGDGEMRPVLLLSVAPSLVAAAALGLAVLSPALAGIVLAAGLVGALPIDRRLARMAVFPRWWMALRTPLSLGLAAAMLALAWTVA